MILNSKSLAVLLVTILFGGIMVSSWMGWWQTESTKIAATFTEGEFAGQANPADIRGSYTFGDVEKNFSVPANELGQAFGITENPSIFQVKNLEGTVTETGEEVGTASVRLFVAFYKNLPFDLSTDIYVPESAAAILEARNLTADQTDYLETHTVVVVGPAGSEPESAAQEPAEGVNPAQPTATPHPVESAEGTSVNLIKGKTTIGEILTWGVPQSKIEEILGIPMPAATSVTLKDFCSANQLNFEVIKPALQVEVDKIK